MIVQNHFMLPQESIADNTICIKQCILAFYVLPACSIICCLPVNEWIWNGMIYSTL